MAAPAAVIDRLQAALTLAAQLDQAMEVMSLLEQTSGFLSNEEAQATYQAAMSDAREMAERLSAELELTRNYIQTLIVGGGERPGMA